MKYIAHRGMNRMVLENTLPAFERAYELADGVELDVQRARCGTPVVFHDDDLHDIFGEPGSVADYSAEELSRLEPKPSDDFNVPYDGWKPSAAERIPTLEAVLRTVPDDYFVNIELKAPELHWRSSARAVASVIDDVPGNYLVSSFNPLELARFAAASPQTPLGLLYTPDSNLVLRSGWPAAVLGLARLEALHPNWKLVSPDLLQRAHERGWKVNVWTVNDPERAAWLTREGVDALISDEPDVLRASAGQ